MSITQIGIHFVVQLVLIKWVEYQFHLKMKWDYTWYVSPSRKVFYHKIVGEKLVSLCWTVFKDWHTLWTERNPSWKFRHWKTMHLSHWFSSDSCTSVFFLQKSPLVQKTISTKSVDSLILRRAPTWLLSRIVNVWAAAPAQKVTDSESVCCRGQSSEVP